jgi:membrane-associated phospholipid phosphatase
MESEAFSQQNSSSNISRRVALTSRIIGEFAPHEVLLIFFAALLSLIAVVAHVRVTEWPQVLLNMFIAVAIIISMSFWSVRAGTIGFAGRWPRRLRLFYLFPVIPIYFISAGLISHPLHVMDFDSMLIAADRTIFGVNPTVWLYEHFPTWPWLTEYFMLCYSAFYFLPLGLAIELYKRARKKDEFGHTNPFLFGGARSGDQPEPVEQVVFIILYGFLLSYMGYICIPAIGPRFTVHNFLNLSNELPGLFLTEPLRTLLNRGENVLPGMSMSNILAHVTRDAFPSGHTDVTVLTILLAFQFRSRLRWPITVIGLSLIFSTIYLRFHYVVDVIAGAILALVTLYSWQWVRERMIEIRARFVQ